MTTINTKTRTKIKTNGQPILHKYRGAYTPEYVPSLKRRKGRCSCSCPLISTNSCIGEERKRERKKENAKPVSIKRKRTNKSRRRHRRRHGHRPRETFTKGKKKRTLGSGPRLSQQHSTLHFSILPIYFSLQPNKV